MKTCFLHAGLHKTGTTALQHYLASNFEAMKSGGLLAPRIGMSKQGAHHALVRAIVGAEDGPPLGADLPSIAARFSRWRGDMIISSESMQNLFAFDQAGTVVRFFQECGYRIVTVFYFREQADWINAKYGQGIKTFRFLGRIGNLVASNRANGTFLYSNRIRVAEALGCQVIARRYTSGVRAAGIAGDFFSAIGRPLYGTLSTSGRHNEAVGPVALAVAGDIHDKLLTSGLQLSGMQQIRCGLAFRDVLRGFPAEPRQPWFFTQRQTRFIRELTAEDNAEMSRRFWDGMGFEDDDREPVFFDALHASAEQHDLYNEIFRLAWPRILDVANDAAIAARPLRMIWQETREAVTADYTDWPLD